jgi:hypothetical protein
MEKDVDYAWVMMDWCRDFREKQKKLFKWETYPIITKLTEIGPMYDPDYIEDLVGGFNELQLELLSTEE